MGGRDAYNAVQDVACHLRSGAPVTTAGRRDNSMPESQKIIGKYRILERIARGGMGTIFKAYDPVLDRPVALKVISSEIDVSDDLRGRFFREAQACARLSHPNIVIVYDMGEDEGRLFIVMELLDGEEMRRLITERTPLPLEDKLSIMTQVCEGLHYAHQCGVVHVQKPLFQDDATREVFRGQEAGG